MVAIERLEWAIEQHYKSIDTQNTQRTITKNWCLTVWLLLLAVLISGRFTQAYAPGVVMTFLPIVLFWIIEGLQASHMKIMELRVAELEKLWLNSESKIKKSSDILFYGSHQYQSAGVKMNMFTFALFRMETVFAFYALLSAINLIANVVFIVGLT